MTKPAAPLPNRKRTPCHGLKAVSTTGASAIWITPRKPISPKNSTITGPKKVATLAVPERCTENSAMRITTVIGRM